MLRIETLRKINVMRGILVLDDVVSEHGTGTYSIRVLLLYYANRGGGGEGRVPRRVLNLSWAWRRAGICL